jgi:hypothetical protein
VERSDTHHVLDDSDGFREGLNPSYDLLPDRQITEFLVHPFSQKYFTSPIGRNTFITHAVSFSQRGAARDRHGRWERDAVDAAASARER